MGPDYFTDHLLGRIGRQEYKIYQINKEMSATQQRVDELKKVQAELEAERKRLDDLKYIEKLAREDHNMVGKNEVPLFIRKGKCIPVADVAESVSRIREDSIQYVGYEGASYEL